MTEQKFSEIEAIKLGWNLTKANLWFFVKFGLIMVVFFIISNILAEAGEIEIKKNIFIGILYYFVGLVLQSVIIVGLIRICLKVISNKKWAFSDILSSADLIFNYIVAEILYTLIIFAGFLLLIVPGVIWAIKFSFYDYFIIDKGLGPIEAFKRSSEITMGVKKELFVFWLYRMGILLLGLLCLLIGLFIIALPVTYIAMASVYYKLESAANKDILQTPTGRYE